MSEPVVVSVPGGKVYLAPALPVPVASAAFVALEGSPATEHSMQAILIAVYFQPRPRGVIWGWEGKRFTTKDGEVEAVTDEAIDRLLTWDGGGLEVAQRCNSLYAGELFRPLASGRQKSSRPGPTDISTSANPEAGSTPPKRSKRSSPNGTAGMESVAPVR